MALYAFPGLTISLDDELDTLRDISAYVTHINGFTMERILEELTAAGDDDERWTIVGIDKTDPIVLTGPYDDAANGLYDCSWIAWETVRTFRITTEIARNIEVYIESVEIKVERGKLDSVIVTLQPTGAVT